MTTIHITQGLFASDTVYSPVALDAVEEHLKENRQSYERTNPINDSPVVFNRAYIDVDGFAVQTMGVAHFCELVENITTAITLGIEGISLMNSSKWDKAGDHKLSFRVTYLKKHGTRSAIKKFAFETFYPILRDLLKDFIVVSDTKLDTTHLNIDAKVYGANRKMRMWNSSKDYQKRPYVIVGDATVLDTLITYIPEDSEALPEPTPIRAPAPIRVPAPRASVTPVSDPAEESDGEQNADLLIKVIMGLAPARYNDYDDFIKVGFICFNSGLPLSVWEQWAKQCPRNKPGDCATHWKGFKKGPLTEATLWMWLKKDNPTLYSELVGQRNDFWSLIANPNHAETARFFYNLKPDGYIFNETLNWYQLLPTNVWKHYEKTPSGLMTDIWMTLKKVANEFGALLDLTSTDEKVKTKLKNISAFGRIIGNKGFVDGVVSFLPANYNDDELVKKMDESRHLFAFLDKVVDLNTNEVRDIRPTDYVCLTTGYAYPTQSNPTMRKEIMEFLLGIWENEEMLNFVLKVIALQLSGTQRFEHFYVFTGKGGNGKGLITDSIKRVFGNYYYQMPTDALTKRSDRPDAPNPGVIQSRGKRYVGANEPEADEKIQTGFIKLVTGGDVISVRQLFKPMVEFVPQFGLFLQCNMLPKLTKLDGGVKRRMVVVPFPFQFVDEPTESHHRKIDRSLKTRADKDDDWRAEFVRILLDIYPTIGNTLDMPSAVGHSTEDYLNDNDPVRNWLLGNYNTGLDINDKTYWMSGDELRKAFLEETGTAVSAMTASFFKTLMEMNGVQQKRQGNPFKGPVWNGVSYVETQRPSGSYYLGLERKR